MNEERSPQGWNSTVLLGQCARASGGYAYDLIRMIESDPAADWLKAAPGSMPAAASRARAKGLLEVDRTERPGKYPERQVLRITSKGRRELDEALLAGLTEPYRPPSPIDVAIAFIDLIPRKKAAAALAERRKRLLVTAEGLEAFAAKAQNEKQAEAASWLASRDAMLCRAESAWVYEVLEALRSEDKRDGEPDGNQA